MTKELTFQLDDKLRFADEAAGQEDKTMQILLRAPSYDDRKFYARMHSHVSGAFIAMTAKVPDRPGSDDRRKTQEDMDGSTAMTMLSAGSEDFDRVLEDFSELALRVGWLNEATALKDKHLQDIGVDALMRMCGEYVAFFIAPSLLSMTKRSGSRA